MSDDAADRLEGAVNGLGSLPPIDDLDPERLLENLRRDKKRDDGGVGWVLPSDDGVVLDQRVSAEEMKRVLREISTG